ncbi:MAG: PAS domain-containing sensor histidine kinase [Phycisphaera sp.]|nr:MAG: PAS domain-containing sensor histidine kinase [Phycisphaera sp.]
MGERSQRWFVIAGLAGAGALVLILIDALPIVAAGLIIASGLAVWRGAVATTASARIARDDAGKARASLASLEAVYRELSMFFQTVDEPLLVCDERQAVILVNEAGCQWLEMAREDVHGRRIDEVFTNAEVLSLHARASRGERCRRRITITGENGYRVADVSAVPVPVERGAHDDGKGVLLVLRDVSELARALEIRTDFAANASHELRTPIAALRGAVETLQGPASRDEAMRTRLLSMLDENVFRLEDLIRDLLDLSRLEALEGSAKLVLVPASELVRVLAQNFEAMCERGAVTLRFEIDPELEALRTDRNLVTIILRNLIENAIKFSDKGDEVLVRGVVEPGADPNAARTCVFEVIDQGQGIPLAMQQRIFERFYQADTSRDGSKVARGTGLGLAIVKHAVRTLGGTIKVKSVWQRGTTMTVELAGAVPTSDKIDA